MDYQKLRQNAIALICGAPGHDEYFRNDPIAKRRILALADHAKKQGIASYLHREYPTPDSKSIIINEINGRLYCVDGNCHLVSLLIAKPDLTIGGLLQYSSKVVRLWHEGIEGDQNRAAPYDVYIPYGIDTHRLPDVRIGMDYFKPTGEQIKIIHANLAFDSDLFLPREKGYPLYQTALSVLSSVC